jgi:glycosyltransferase involved in cell wall biosynthesis
MKQSLSTKAPILNVACPWNLPHYICANGFHPLYRPLFDNLPENISINTWDMTALSKLIATDPVSRETMLNMSHKIRKNENNGQPHPLTKTINELFYPPNKVLTSQLPGEIEFHHTTPFPSLKRPFVFHCELFESIFFPNKDEQNNTFLNSKSIKNHYQQLFANPLCLGIFSHIPQTLENFRVFFKSKAIENKLFLSTIGLGVKTPNCENKTANINQPTFLFTNAKKQEPKAFFNQGGHIVLEFWKQFKKNNRDGLLILDSYKPLENELTDSDVDTDFLQQELGQSIIWIDEYLTKYEKDTLLQKSDFLLLPGTSLHSTSIMQAMKLGTIPIASDVIGTDTFISDNKTGIILKGMREATTYKDPHTGIITPIIEQKTYDYHSITTQITKQITAILDKPNELLNFQERCMQHASKYFISEDFNANFWGNITNLYSKYTSSNNYKAELLEPLSSKLTNCLTSSENFATLFEGESKPRTQIEIGSEVISEFAGTLVGIKDAPIKTINNWSPLDHYFSENAPKLYQAKTLPDLENVYLYTDEIINHKKRRLIVRALIKLLYPFPSAHSYAAGKLRKYRKYHQFMQILLSKQNFSSSAKLIFENVNNYNVLHFQKTYYSIPQAEGVFILEKITNKEYASFFVDKSILKILYKVYRHGIYKKKKAPVVARKTSESKKSAPDSPPKVSLEGVKDYNIISYLNKYYAIPQSGGSFSLKKIANNEYSSFYVEKSILKVIDKIYMNGVKQKKGNRIITGSMKLLSKSPKLYDFASRRLKKTRKYYHFLQLLLSKQSHKSSAEQHIESLRNYNIFYVLNKYYAIPKAEGQIMLEKITKKEYPSFFIDNSILILAYKIYRYGIFKEEK